jgi:ABC-type polysaccharide/polyol phosphate export permease
MGLLKDPAMKIISRVHATENTGRFANANRLSVALSDLALGLAQWRVWWVLGLNDIRQRYRRSTLGQFWLTISIAATIAGVGIVFGVIFNQRLESYIPFLGIGLVIWALLAGLINELATSFISAETHLRSYPTPRSAVIYRTIMRNLLVSAHNFLIVPLLLLLFQIPLTPVSLLALPALGVIALNGVWIGLLIGPLSARFRDLPQIIANVVQLAFFVTPVMYRPSQLQERLWVVTDLNPFASFLEIVRAPLLGEMAAAHHYLMVALCTLIGFAVAIPFYARFRGRIVYWL